MFTPFLSNHYYDHYDDNDNHHNYYDYKPGKAVDFGAKHRIPEHLTTYHYARR